MSAKIPNVLPCQREWYLRNVAPPPPVKPAPPVKAPKVRTEITELETRALAQLQGVTFPVGCGPKRFARQMNWATDITDGQREYLWGIVYTFRRQIHDDELLKIAQEKHDAATKADNA